MNPLRDLIYIYPWIASEPGYGHAYRCACSESISLEGYWCGEKWGREMELGGRFIWTAGQTFSVNGSA